MDTCEFHQTSIFTSQSSRSTSHGAILTIEHIRYKSQNGDSSDKHAVYCNNSNGATQDLGELLMQCLVHHPTMNVQNKQRIKATKQTGQV